MNSLTTPVIEIAGDGKTAKGLRYSPGINILGAFTDDGKTSMRGEWRMTKYGVDFVKEDCKWKIWHIVIYFDNTPPGWSYEDGQPVYKPVGVAGPDSTDVSQNGKIKRIHPSHVISGISLNPNPEPYKAWRPTLVPKMWPRLPEPYYTFSETFSY